MLKTITLILIVLAVFTVFSVIIPDSITSSIDSAFIYFLTAIWGVAPAIGTQTVTAIMTSFQILANFYAGISVFFIFHWILRAIK